MTELGFISRRNEDGTEWLTTFHEIETWTPAYGERKAFTRERFDELVAGAPETTKNNSPDNGFFGNMNLKFVVCTQEEAHEQDIASDALLREAEEAEDYDDDPLGAWHGRNE